MNKRGQALVEFIIILPIFLVLVMGVIDIGNIFYHKTVLEGAISDVISLYDAGYSIEEIKKETNLEDVEVVTTKNGDQREFHLTEEIDMITPGLNLIFDNPYIIDISRSVYE